MKDYYSLLGIKPDATKAEIKKNYRVLATKFHPDKNTDHDAASKFIAITEAYDILSNKKGRIKYDQMRWEMLKRKQDSQDSFIVVEPPRESQRTRRNKAQQKRSVRYHQATSQMGKLWKIIIESFIITGRYLTHLLGIIIFSVILKSAVGQLAEVFDQGIGRGLGICVFVVALVYVLFKISINIFQEFKLDVEAFTVFYRQPRRTLGLLSGFLFFCFLVLLGYILKAY